MESYIKTHLFYIILILAGLGLFRFWIHEHDARIAAEATVKQEQTKVADLQDQIKAVNAAAARQVQVVVRTVEAVKTVPQAVTAIPQLTDVPLNARPSVDKPEVQVSVDAVPLVQALGQCKTDKINLDACQQDQIKLQAIVDSKDKQILALQKKPRFWARLWGYTKVGLAFAGIGIAVGKAAL